jgi:hypothetical protein
VVLKIAPNLINWYMSSAIDLIYSGAQVANRHFGGLVQHGREWPLNDGQIPYPNVVCVALGTGYNRVDGNRRASRNGLVSDLPPEIPNANDSATFSSLYHTPGRPLAPPPPPQSFSTHAHLSAAQGSSTTVSNSDIQYLDSSAHGLARRWLLIGYFPIHLLPAPTEVVRKWSTVPISLSYTTRSH